MSDAPAPTKYEGPFKKVRPPGERRPSKGWLSPWRIYGLGAIAAMGLTAFYLFKLTFTPDMLIKAAEAPAPPEPPEPKMGAYCFGAGGRTPARVEPSPFCTEAREPGCKDGELLQLTYASPDPAVRFAYVAVLRGDLAAEPLTPSGSREIRPGAVDAPLAQWRVRSVRQRTPLALVGLFSREPLAAADVAPWFEAWRTRERLLSRTPPLGAALTVKGTTLSAFLVCVGR